MKNIIVITSILFLAVIASAVFYFSNIEQENKDQGRLLTHIPANAAFISSFQNDKSFYDIFSDYEAIQGLLGEKSVHQLSFLYDTFLKSDAFGELLAKQRIYISFHPGAKGFEWLISISFAQKTSVAEATALLAKTGDISISDVNGTENCYALELKNLGSSVYIGFKPNAALLSFSKELISEALDEQAPHISERFIQEIQQNRLKAENDLLTLYVNQGQIFPSLQNMMNVKPGNIMNIIKGWKGLTSLSMNYKSDAFMFSGPSSLDSSRNTYLELFSQQQAVPQELKKIIPENTATFLSFALSDYDQFHRGLVQLLQNRKQLDGMRQQFAHISATQKVAIDSSFIRLWDNEFGYIELNTREQIGLAKIKDRQAFDSVMPKLSTYIQDSIYRMDNSNLLYYAFGDPLVDFQRPYFIVLDHHYICANTISTLQRYRQNYQQHRVMANMAEYIEFDNMQAHKANITFFMHNANANNNLKRSLKKSYYTAYDDEEEFGYKRFYGLSVQLSAYNGSFFANIYAKYIPSDAETRTALWNFKISDSLSVAPAVLQYNDSSRFILAQESNGRLFAIDSEGKQLWSAALAGPAMGSIQQLSDRSIVLVTKQKLYRFRADGSPLAGFPIELEREATYSATVVEQEGENRRIYVPAGEHILAFDEKGNGLEGWKNKAITGNILFGLKAASVADTKYIIALTDIGRVYFFNYNGGLVSLNEDITKKHFANPFGLELVDDDPSKSRVITSDTSGMIKSFFFDNNQLRKRIGSWGGNHFFDAQNITGDSIPELIVLDKKHLYVYNNADSSLVFDHGFNQEIEHRPQFFAQDNKKKLIGIASPRERLLFLFEEDGNIAKGFPVNGLPNFYFGRLKNDGHRYLICASDERTLSAYRF